MIIDVKSKTEAEFTRNFKERVTLIKSYYSRERLKQRGKFVGYIEGDQFWLVKTRDPFSLTPCRRFCGRIIEDTNEAFVQGEFRMDRAYLLYIILVFASSIFAFFIRDPGLFREPAAIIMLLLLLPLIDAIPIGILYWVNRYSNEEISKEVAEFISEL